MPIEDKALGHRVRKELVKRQNLDVSRAEVYTLGGRVTVYGIIRVLRGANIDPRRELEILARAIRSVPGVREVEFNVRFVGAASGEFRGPLETVEEE